MQHNHNACVTTASMRPAPTSVSTTPPSIPMVVATFYQFVTLDDYADMKQPLLDYCRQHQIKGTILLAHEGINATIAGPETGIHKVLSYLRCDPRLAALEHKVSSTTDYPFYRMKVKLKREIVTMGVADVNPGTQAGEYVTPAEWNSLIQDDQVLLVDTRNDYEVDLGTFTGAVRLPIKTFRELPAHKNNILNLMQKQGKSKLAMFCTGGIRCEKSTAFMKEHVNAVYHLQGGILKYLQDIPQEQSLWQGDCFVFDNRVAVDHQLAQGNYQQCFACRHPVTEEDMASVHYQKGICCPYCHDHISDKTRARVTERQKQMELAKQRQMPHLGITLEEAKQSCHKIQRRHQQQKS